MNKPSIESAVHEAFSRRCQQLGIAVWFCDSSGNVIRGPAGQGVAIDAAKITALIAQAAANQANNNRLPSLDGQHLVVFEEKLGAQTLSISAALLPKTESRDHLVKMLRWMYDDLLHTASDQKTIDQFSDRLAQTYEENSVLMGLSRALNRDAGPVEIIESICQQLHETLPFGLLGIRLAATEKQVPELSEKLVLCGTPPAEAQKLER